MRREIKLERMTRLAAEFGNVQNKFKVVHIAGTNGKGSVAKKTSVALQSLGFKVGLFTSPHIEHFEERISVNGTNITLDAVAEHSGKILSQVVSRHTEATWFD